MNNYELWYGHGESHPTQDVGQCSNPIPSHLVGQCVDEDVGEYTEHDQMVMDGMHQNYDPYYQQGPQDPNQTAQAFYNMLEQANEPLWEGCKETSTLSITTMLLNWKSDCNIFDSTFDKLLFIIKDILPDGNKLARNFYETKKMLKPLELPSQQIHVCKNHCMLFYGQYSNMDRYIVCKEDRYKEKGNKVPKLVMHYPPIGPRLQRLFYSQKTAQHMTWHADHHTQPGSISHPNEGRAWNHFGSIFCDFAQETHNVRLGLCTDGFNPNTTNGSSYSCWPVFITVYNLPPWLALKERYIQLPLIIPGPESPKQNLGIFLQPLIDELKMLFTHGVETYDAYTMNNFQMKAVLLWTISDFPAYAMLSGWSTHGRHAVHHAGGIDSSPISSDAVASGRHVTRGLDEITHDDAYDDSEGQTRHPSRQNMFNIDAPRNTSGKKFIERIGDKFADHDVHGPIRDILLEHYDAPWATFKMVPKNTLFCWDPENDKLKYDAFINVLKDRFRDIMSDWRLESKSKARAAKHDIGDKEHRFNITYRFPPSSMSSDVWEQLCLGWNTEKWLNKSESGRNNRTKEVSGGGISRHTGGSIGFDERRIRLEKEHGRKIKWIEVKYRRDMIKLHGLDINQHPDDLDAWTNVARSSRGRVFGIGSSDPHFLVTGKLSTSSRSASYFGDLRSQEEVQKVRAEMEEELENERKSRNELEERVQRMEQMEKEVEDERKSRNELEERVQRMEQMEKERKENEERRQRQFDEFMRKFQPPGSNY